MNLQQRKELLVRLGNYMKGSDEAWLEARQKAFAQNHWFIPEFINLSIANIVDRFLQPSALEELSQRYRLPDENPHPKKLGVVMAGNIPLVGFHDLLCVFLTGHIAMVKPSSRDEELIKHLVGKFYEWAPETNGLIILAPLLRNCDAYIATGSNNSSRYFEFYFQKYPHIIRKNRTSVAVLTGKESKEDLEKLADDVYQFFGLGCRNVTKIFVPREYNFELLLEAFRKYDYLANHHKFKNNYDYNLTVHILNNKFYMTNGSIILVENDSAFSPISQLHYSFFDSRDELMKELKSRNDLQCIVGEGAVNFGEAQCPAVLDFADGVDTMTFLTNLDVN